MSEAEAKRALKKKPKPEAPPPADDRFVSLGSTLVNLACTGKTKCGLEKGTYCLMVGDSNSGKTWLSLATLAEASINPAFDGYRLVYDGPENGALMDFRKCFGPKMEEKVERPEPSATVEEFYDRADKYVSEGPCIIVLDSMDALTSEADEEQVQKERDAREKGKEVTGSYGTAKAKANSARLRTLVAKLAENGSILIIISQTRDNIGFGAMFNPKTRSGGKALKFYAHTEIWTSIKKSIDSKKLSGGKTLQIGLEAMVKVKRSRHTGKERDVIVPIYHSVGVDDIGSMVKYLVDWGHWKKSGTIDAKDLSLKGYEEELCKQIDQRKLKPKLRAITGKFWRQVEAACKVERSNPYESED